MPLSAKDALILARTNIENARNARGSEPEVIKFYQVAKNAIGRVDATKTGITDLKDMIAAFEELAAVLDHSGEQSRGKAIKCRQRAHGLRKILTMRTNNHTAVAPTDISSATPLKSSITVAVSTASNPHQLSLHSSQSAGSIPATSSPQPFFYRDVNPVPPMFPFPSPGEPLENTGQLAYCLALLQASTQEDGLFPGALEWRRNTLNNLDEKERLEAISIQVIKAFSKDTMKDAAAVAEVVQLTPVLNEEHSRFLLKTFMDTVNRSEILHFHSLEGLAKAIEGAAPGSIDSEDLVAILQSLHKRLKSLHKRVRPTSSASHQYHLLLTVSQVLNAMVDAGIGGVDRANLYEPLSDLLRGSELSENPYLTFQIEYATQALLHVSDDENIWRAGFRRACLVLKGGAGFAKMPDPTEIKDALEGIEKLYEAGQGGVRLFMDIREAIKHDEPPTFTVEEGLKFKRAWYRSLRTAESYIQSGRLVRFKNLVTTAPCRHQLMFQWGICLLIGQFAADTQWDLKARKEAVLFLGALSRDGGIWTRKNEVDQVIFDALTNLASVNDMDHEVVTPLMVKLKKQNAALKSIANLQSPLWSNSRYAGPTTHVVPKISLLKAVQDRSRRNTKMDNLPDQPALSSLDDIHSALKAYHEPDLFILRVSGQKLDLEPCYVNLAIVEATAHREKEKQDLKDEAAVFHRISSFERLRNANTQSLIPLEELFDKRKLRDEKEITPKRILVQGRAGIGKTTLCKKLVHIHQSGLWSDLFDAVLWLPLRRLRGCTSRTLEDLFCEKIFVAQGLKQEQTALANALAVRAKNGKVLFILDGLDEIVTDIGNEENGTFRTFLKKVLLEQEYVIITSRPSGVDSTLLPPIDLDLETVGFSQKNVNDFVVKVLDPEPARAVLDFIQQTPLIHGLVNIPVQLDVICFTWDSLPKDGPALTMTGLYRLMVRKLWCKDAVRLKKEADSGKVLMEKHIHKLSADRINRLMAEEVQHLGYLAFKGMNNKHQIEFDEDDLLIASEDLDNGTAETQGRSPPEFVDALKETSFLHTADVDLNSRCGSSRQAWHFLHLTFQEYFAATWIVRHFQSKPKSSTIGMMTVEQVEAFVHQHKYNPQYEIVWSMVAGLLEGEPLRNYFQLFQAAPRDLIGVRHQQILASCLNEARTRLDPVDVEDLDSELMDWLRFEISTSRHDKYRETESMLGSQISFPEVSLVRELHSVSSIREQRVLLNTLKARSVLSDSAIQLLITILRNGDDDARRSATSALSSQSKLSESAIQSLIAALRDEVIDVRHSAAWALDKQFTLPQSAFYNSTNGIRDVYRDVRSSATYVLGRQSKLSESAIQSLIAALKDEHLYVKSLVARLLGNQSTLPESALQSLIAALKNEHPDVRSSVARVLGNQSTLPESALQSLIAALNDEHPGVRSSVAETLGKQSTLPESAIQSLVAALKCKDDHVRNSAAKILGNNFKLPDSAIQLLITILRNGDDDARRSATSALSSQSKLSESAIQSLIAALRDEAIDVRHSAAWALDKQFTLPQSAFYNSTNGIRDVYCDVRSSATYELGRQSKLSESAIQSLIAALKDEHPYVKSLVARILGNQSTLPESALQSLIATLKDEHPDVRSSVARVLGNQSTLPESALQSLIAAINDEHPGVRSSVALALGSLSTLSESGIRFLIVALKDEDEHVRSSAASVLGRQSTLPDSALQSLIAALRDEHPDARALSARILGSQSTMPESVIQSLISALKDEDDDVRDSAVTALRNKFTLPESALQSLIVALKDEHPDVRSSVARVLGQQSTLPESVIQSLISALRDEDDDVRRSATNALGSQSKLSEPVIQSLIAALKDEAGGVRRSAAMMLCNKFTLPLTNSQFYYSRSTLQNTNYGVRHSAISKLGSQSKLSESAIQSLIAALRGKVGDIRRSTAEVLGGQSTLSESAIQSLIAALRDEVGDVRQSAAWVLGRQFTIPESSFNTPSPGIRYENLDVRRSATSALSSQSKLSESTIQSLIAALKDEHPGVRSSAAYVLGSQSKLSESAIQSLIAALKDEHPDVRSSVAQAFDTQSALPGWAIQYFIDALKDEHPDARAISAGILGSQSTLPESALQALIAALEDEDDDRKKPVIRALHNQPVLPESAFQSLIVALKAGDDFVRWSVSETLEKHLHSLCISLSHLTADEVAYLYENHLFGYSCSHVLSLQVQNGRMRLYTEQGAMDVEITGSGGEGNILSAFRRVHDKAGLKL